MKCRSIFKRLLMIMFIIIELILFVLIHSENNLDIKILQYSSIILCLIYMFTNLNINNRYLICGMIMTSCADLFLVLFKIPHQLYGMFFFLIAQIFYAIKFYKLNNKKIFIILRIVLISIVELIAYLVLKDKLNLLVIISLAYYVNIIINLIESLFIIKKEYLLTIGLFLFIICDTIIGLKVMNEAYISINNTGLLYKILYCRLDIAWVCYLPSQVLIALSSYKNGGKENEI